MFEAAYMAVAFLGAPESPKEDTRPLAVLAGTEEALATAAALPTSSLHLSQKRWLAVTSEVMAARLGGTA